MISVNHKLHTYPSSNAVLAFKSFEVIIGVHIVLPELFDNILADIAVVFFDGTGNDHLIFWWDDGRLSSFSEKVLHEGADIASSNWNVLDGRSDNIALSLNSRLLDPATVQNSGPGHTTGITWVTPSPESTTVPVRVRSVTLFEAHEAARASTAWTAM